jgi:hypothetical protein
MRGLLCGTTARTNEEYKKVVKVRMNRFLGLGAIGAVTLTLGLLAEFYWRLDVREEMLGVYTGMGTGLVLVSVILWVKNRVLLASEEKLKESRINNSDERIKEISDQAFRTAAEVMLGVMYLISLIGGLFYPVLVQVLLAVVSIFALTYLISYHIYNKKM